MTNNIFNFALKCGEINRDALCEMCDRMEPKMRQRFVEAILGIVDVKAIEAELPRESSKDRCYGIRTLVSYNYLTDVVAYKYKETVRRYFQDAEKAEKYAQTGNCSYADYEGREQGAFTIAAEYEFEREGTCGLWDWTQRV